MNEVNSCKFDHLAQNLIRSNAGNSYFKNTRMLVPLNKFNYKECLLERFCLDTVLIIEPSIIGFGVSLHYEKGLLMQAITREGNDITKSLNKKENFPKKLPVEIDIQVRGKLYNSAIDNANVRLLANRYLIKGKFGCERLRVCVFQILNTDLNHSTQLRELEKLGFETPEHEMTSFIGEIDLYLELWEECKLFSKYPSNGIVLKVNSRRFQKQLGQNYSFLNWAFIIKSTRNT